MSVISPSENKSCTIYTVTFANIRLEMDREGSEGFENLQENICNFLELSWPGAESQVNTEQRVLSCSESNGSGFALRAAGQILLCLPLYMTPRLTTLCRIEKERKKWIKIYIPFSYFFHSLHIFKFPIRGWV